MQLEHRGGHQPPAVSPPAASEQWLGFGPVSLHIRSRRLTCGNSLEGAEEHNSSQTSCEERGTRKQREREKKNIRMLGSLGPLIHQNAYKLGVFERKKESEVQQRVEC